MLLSRAKSIFEVKIKTTGGLQAPKDADLSEIFYEALIFIATKCIPKELLKDIAVDTDQEVLRSIKGGFFIMKPAFPIFDVSDINYNALVHLQIDNDLDYAVINKAAALYSREIKNITKFENETTRIINRYKANFNKVGA